MGNSLLKRSLEWFRASWVYIIIFCILFSLRVVAINNKTTFFFDDPASLNVSTPQNVQEDRKKIKYGWADLRFDYGRNYTALEIKKTLFESKSDIKSIVSDLVYLHNKTLDAQHPNLYYSILRIWTAGMDYSDNNAIKWRGCSLNLVFFTLSFFFMFKLLNLIKPDKKFIALGLFFAFVTTGTISNTLLIRPYPMFEAFLISSIYIFVKVFKSIEKNELLPPKKVVLYGLGLGLFFLSDYYSLFMGAFIFMALCYRCSATKNIQWLKWIFLMFLIAFGFVYLFCPLYFSNFKTIEHMTETQNQANIWNFLFFIQYGIYLLTFLSKFIFNNIVFFMILFVLFSIGVPILNDNKLEKEEWRKWLLVVVPTFSWMYIICIISPFHEPAAVRYIIIGFPIIGLVLAYITYRLRKLYAILIVLLTIITVSLPIFENITWYNSKYKCLGEMTYFNDYDWLNVSESAYNAQTGKNRPIIVINKNWLFPSYLLYLKNNAIIRFEKEIPPANKNFIFDDYIILILNITGAHIIDNN